MFAGYLDEGFAGKQPGTVNCRMLGREDPTVFAEFVTWLYSHKLTVGGENEALVVDVFKSLVGLWNSAHRYFIPLLMNEVIDTLHKVITDNGRLPSGTLGMVFSDATEEGSAIRRFMIFAYAELADPRRFVADFYACSPRPRVLRVEPAMRRIFTAAVPTRSPKAVGEVDLCYLHVHDKGVRCRR